MKGSSQYSAYGADVAFMRMMMAHAQFESEVCALQGVVANDRYYGEQPENLWSAKKRPKLMVKLIEKRLGQIPETEHIKKLLAIYQSEFGRVGLGAGRISFA